jgi:hypothetical protein
VLRLIEMGLIQCQMQVGADGIREIGWARGDRGETINAEVVGVEKRAVTLRCGYNGRLSDGEGWQTVVGDTARISRREEREVRNESPFEQAGLAAASASETPVTQHVAWTKGNGSQKRGTVGL